MRRLLGQLLLDAPLGQALPSRQQRVKNLLGPGLAAYFPLWEAGGTVVEDLSGHGRDGAYTAGGVSYRQAGIRGGQAALFDGASGYANLFSAGLGAALNPLEGALVVNARVQDRAVWTDGAVHRIVSLVANSTNKISIYKPAENNRITAYYYGNSVNRIFYLNNADSPGWFQAAISWSQRQNRIQVYLNGLPPLAALAMTPWTGGAFSALRLASDPETSGRELKAWACDAALLTRPLSDGDALALFDLFFPRVNLVFDGDSLTLGTGVALHQDYPERVCLALNQPRWRNFGVWGQPVSAMIADAATQVDPLVRSRDCNVIVVWGGLNDVAAGATPETAYARIVQYCQERRAAGWDRVIVLTQLPRYNQSEATRAGINDPLRANWAAFADALVDVGADSRIGTAEAYADTNYYNADQVHLTDAGYQVVADLVRAAIEGMVSP